MKQKAKPTIEITMEGGLIQHVRFGRGVPKGLRVAVIDFDTEDSPEDDLTMLASGQLAFVTRWENK